MAKARAKVKGKPVKTDVKTDEKIDIRLRVDSEFYARVQAAADDDGNSVAAFIRTAIVRELKRREREGSE